MHFRHNVPTRARRWKVPRDVLRISVSRARNHELKQALDATQQRMRSLEPMEQFAKETHPISLEQEMRRSYLDYAMSVIVGAPSRMSATA